MNTQQEMNTKQEWDALILEANKAYAVWLANPTKANERKLNELKQKRDLCHSRWQRRLADEYRESLKSNPHSIFYKPN